MNILHEFKNLYNDFIDSILLTKEEIELKMKNEELNISFRKVLYDPNNEHTEWFNSLPIQKKGFVVKSCMRGVDIEEIKKRCEMF